MQTRRASSLCRGARWRGHCAGLAVGTALAPTLLSGHAAAAETAPIRIEYSAPASCPDGRVLFTHVQARAARARAAGPSETAREVTVRVEETDGHFLGRLLTTSLEGDRQTRVITDASCDELVEALGFFIALSIDPEAMALAPASTWSLAEPASQNAVPPAGPTNPVPSAPRTMERAGSPSSIDREGHWSFGVGAGPVFVSGPAPKMVLGSRAYVVASYRRVPRSIVAPFLSAGVISTSTASDRTALGGLALRWRAVATTLCPFELPLYVRAAFRLCSLVEVGQVQGEGIEIRSARRTESTWVAVGLSARLELMLWSALFLELEVGGAAPLVRTRFHYTSGATAFETPALGSRTSVSFAFRR